VQNSFRSLNVLMFIHAEGVVYEWGVIKTSAAPPHRIVA